MEMSYKVSLTVLDHKETEKPFYVRMSVTAVIQFSYSCSKYKIRFKMILPQKISIQGDGNVC
jgi:hypothetical protein